MDCKMTSLMRMRDLNVTVVLDNSNEIKGKLVDFDPQGILIKHGDFQVMYINNIFYRGVFADEENNENLLKKMHLGE